MSHPFQILTEFLRQYGDEVEGRSLEEPNTEIKRKLQRFVSGASEETERTELVGLLQDNPQWVPWLAAEVKAQRTEKS
jgi:hypothetical protein